MEESEEEEEKAGKKFLMHLFLKEYSFGVGRWRLFILFLPYNRVQSCYYHGLFSCSYHGIGAKEKQESVIWGLDNGDRGATKTVFGILKCITEERRVDNKASQPCLF